MSDENFFSKKGERKVSAFIGQELLYDYITGQLDSERKKAIEEFIDNNREIQGDITKINNGLAYVDKMSQAVVSQPLLEQIKQPSSYLEMVLMKIRFDQWPQGLRLGLEALVVALGIAAIALVVPWHKIMNMKIGGSDIVLTEVSTQDRTEEAKEIPAKEKENAEFADEVPGQENNLAETQDNSDKGEQIAKKESVQQVSAVTPTTSTTIPAKTTVAATAAEAITESKRQGFLYRGSIQVTNVAAATPKIVENLHDLGGRKAGDVELGWKRGDGSYFHFTIPESKYQETIAVFNEYGNLKISKEKHERVMPEGIIRLIINVDEKK